MQLVIVEESDVDAALDARIKQGLCRCFPKDIKVFSQTRCWYGSGPAWMVIIDEQQEIIAHLGVVDQTIRVTGEPVRAAGIQCVFVLPEHRGKHLSARLLNVFAEEGCKREYDFGLLLCLPEIQNIYSRCGWRTLNERKIIRTDENGHDVPIPEKNIGMYLPLVRTDFPDGVIHLQGNDW